MSQGSPTQVFIQEKVKKADLKKKKVPMNPQKAWIAKLEAALFWPSKNLYKQCEPGVEKQIAQMTTVKSRAVARLGQQHVSVSSTPKKVKSLNSSTSWLVATTSMYLISYPSQQVKSNSKVIYFLPRMQDPQV